MTEKLSNELARAILGDSYIEDCSYQLETCEEGFNVIITDNVSGSVSFIYLAEEVCTPMPMHSTLPCVYTSSDETYDLVSIYSGLLVMAYSLLVLCGWLSCM